MNKGVALLMQGVVVLIGVATLIFLLWEPHLEGRNAHAQVYDIYLKDPFLAYVYVGSIPFFIALYRAFEVFGQVRRSGAFSLMNVDALRSIKRCAIVLIGFVAGAVLIIILLGDPEDRPAGLFMCLLVTGSSSAIAAAAGMFAQHLEKTFRQSESNLS